MPALSDDGPGESVGIYDLCMPHYCWGKKMGQTDIWQIDRQMPDLLYHIPLDVASVILGLNMQNGC